MAKTETKKKKRNPLVLLIKAVLLVAVLAGGWYFGIGPLLSHQRNQPSTLYVINDTETTYDTVLGWRRLRRVLHADSHVQFQLYVGMREGHTLTLTPEGGGAEKRIKVTLEPDCLLLLNLDRATTYYAYEPERANAERVTQMANLRRQLRERKTPTALDAIVDELFAIGRGTIVESIDAEFIDLHDYTPYLPLVQEFQEMPEPEERTSPLLTTERLELTFGNGTMTWDGAKPQTTKAQLQLGEGFEVLHPGDYRTTVTPRVPIDVNASPEAITVRLFTGDATQLSYQDVTYDGSWSYTAHKPAGSGWEWNWTFSGGAEVKTQQWSLTIVYPSNGKPRANIEKMEMEAF